MPPSWIREVLRAPPGNPERTDRWRTNSLKLCDVDENNTYCKLALMLTLPEVAHVVNLRAPGLTRAQTTIGRKKKRWWLLTHKLVINDI